MLKMKNLLSVARSLIGCARRPTVFRVLWVLAFIGLCWFCVGAVLDVWILMVLGFVAMMSSFALFAVFDAKDFLDE